MQISGEYGTELLLRYTEEQRVQDLERRRVVNERLAELRADKRIAQPGLRIRITPLIAAHTDGMPSGRRPRAAGLSQVHAAHR
jgi:hypothetical protein